MEVQQKEITNKQKICNAVSCWKEKGLCFEYLVQWISPSGFKVCHRWLDPDTTSQSGASDGVKSELLIYVSLRHLPKRLLVVFQQLEDGSQLLPLHPGRREIKEMMMDDRTKTCRGHFHCNTDTYLRTQRINGPKGEFQGIFFTPLAAQSDVTLMAAW